MLSFVPIASLFYSFLGLEDEGIRVPYLGIRMGKSRIRILLLAFGYHPLYQSCVLRFQREFMFSPNDSFVFQR